MPDNKTVGWLAIGATLGAFAAPAIGGREEPGSVFVKANALVMTRMMERMAAPTTGDVDADFVNMMEPHHRGAIEMAQLELRYGRNEQLRRLAQEIIVSQQQEIVAMRLALDRPLPSAGIAPGVVEDPAVGATKHHQPPGEDH